MDVIGDSTATKPRRTTLEGKSTRAHAELRQSVWEARQFMTNDQVREFVEDVLGEIARDED